MEMQAINTIPGLLYILFTAGVKNQIPNLAGKKLYTTSYWLIQIFRIQSTTLDLTYE